MKPPHFFGDSISSGDSTPTVCTPNAVYAQRCVRGKLPHYIQKTAVCISYVVSENEAERKKKQTPRILRIGYAENRTTRRDTQEMV